MGRRDEPRALPGKRVVLFALPGPSHRRARRLTFPRYDALYEEFRNAGIDEVMGLSVNDAFTMDAGGATSAWPRTWRCGRGKAVRTARAKALLERAGVRYAEDPMVGAEGLRTLRAIRVAATTPQVFVDGRRLGGADELERYLERRSRRGRTRRVRRGRTRRVRRGKTRRRVNARD